MDSGLVMSSHNARSLTTGGNFWQSKHPTKNIYCKSSRTSKVSQYKRKSGIEYNVLRFQQPKGVSTYQECNRKYVVKVVPQSSFDSEPRTDSVKNFLDICYKFSYLYAMIGVILCTFSSSFLAVEKLSDISLSFFIGLLQAVVTHIFVAIYVSAVNQLFDLQIDKINKPYLPFASEQLSFTTVVVIAASFLTLSLGLCWIIGSWPLIWNNVLVALIWSIYSFNVPLLRWKRHPLLAAMCHIFSGGIVMPVTVFLHMQTFVLKRPIVFPRSIIATVLVMSLFYTSVSFAKDISDVEGDKTYGVDTFAIRLGDERVFWIAFFFFEMACGVAFLAGVTSPYLWIKIVTGLGNIVLASIFWHQAKSIDLRNKSSGRSFYMLIWKWSNTALLLLALIR